MIIHSKYQPAEIESRGSVTIKYTEASYDTDAYRWLAITHN